MKVKGMKHGIYEIYWKSGGSSLASVGYDEKGYNWMAPSNWLNGVSLGDGQWGWQGVSYVKMLIPSEYNGGKCKAIRSDYNKVKFNNENFNIEES